MLISYSITFGLALFIGTKVPYINLNYLVSGAVLPVVAVFIVLLIAEVLRNNISAKSKLILTAGTIVGIVAVLCRSGCNWRLRRYSWKIHYSIKPLHQGIVTADRFSRRTENLRLGQPLH